MPTHSLTGDSFVEMTSLEDPLATALGDFHVWSGIMKGGQWTEHATLSHLSRFLKEFTLT